MLTETFVRADRSHGRPGSVQPFAGCPARGKADQG